MTGDYLQQYTYEYLINEALSRVPDNVDKRVGSIIYDALGPACYQLADFYLQLYSVIQDIFPQTAMGEYLELKAGEVGLERRQATPATKRGTVLDQDGKLMTIEIGSRFSTVSDQPIIYKVVSRIGNGVYDFEAEESGTQGNNYTGELVPITNINNLGKVTLGELVIPGSNTETDEELRERFFQYVNEKAFGGNFIDYVSEVSNYNGVGAVQVYPVWAGGGTVKVLVIDSEYNPASSSFQAQVKKWIDPEPHDGTGAGFAPIGHKVTVGTATQRTINVSMTVDIVGYNLAQVTPLIEEKLEQIFLDLRKTWGKFSDDNKYYMSVFRSTIIAAVMTVTGVANVYNVKLNDQDSDINLIFNNSTSQLPYVGTVSVSED